MGVKKIDGITLINLSTYIGSIAVTRAFQGVFTRFSEMLSFVTVTSTSALGPDCVKSQNYVLNG